MNVGFIGLGQMGREMAARLIDAGHSLLLYNRTHASCDGLRARGAAVAKTPDALVDADVVITMLADDAAVRAVWLDSGLASRTPRRTVHLNMATVGLGIARELAAQQFQYVSAPVFGRPPMAAKGELDIIAAGPAAALAACQPLFKALSRQVFVVGDRAEQANAVKIARNFMLAMVIESLGEALALAGKSGVAPQTFLDIITGTSLNSPAYRNYGRLMVEKAYEPAQFAMTLGLKDIELALATAREAQLPLPSAELIRRQLIAAIEKGDGHKDWAALAEHIAAAG